MASLHQLLAS